MDVKAILGKIMDARVVDKKDANDYSKKLNFDLFSKQFYNKINISDTIIPELKFNNLSGPICINFKVQEKDSIYEIHCSENTKFKEIFEKIPFYNISLKINNRAPRRLTFGYIKDKTLKNLNIKDGDIIILQKLELEGGGDEFYIDDDLLDPSYDYDFRDINDENKKFYRGGLEYKRPCGWKRYALKVIGKYENDKWLGDSGGDSEWAVSYHGTKQENMKSIYDNGYRVGINNWYGVGVYCSPNIETAAGYSTEFIGDDGKKYKIVLQNRVRPSAIKKAFDKGGPDDYWYIENGKDIRPYSICVKEY